MTKKTSNKSLRDYFRTHQTKLETDAKIEVCEANETNRTLLNQLFVMAGGVITLSSPIFIDRGILSTIDHSLRWLLVIAIVSATISVASGFAQLYIERQFFRRSKALKLGAAEEIGSGKIRSIASLRELFAKIRRPSDKSSDFFTWLQFISLAIAAIAFVIVMAHILLTVK